MLIDLTPGSPFWTEVTARLQRLYQEGSPWVTFFENYMHGPNSDKPVEWWWMAFVSSGEQEMQDGMEAAIAATSFPPDPTNYAYHRLPLYASALKPYIDDVTWQNVWIPAINALAQAALNVILTDSDDTIYAYLELAGIDALMGTQYLSSDRGKQLHDTIGGYLDRAQGGCWIESFPGYDVLTMQSLCHIACLCGSDHWPQLPQFLKDHARYLVWATTEDLKSTEMHGDHEEQTHDLILHYRVMDMAMVSTLLPANDADNMQLKSLIRSFVPLSNTTPGSMSNLRFALWQTMLFFDPDTLPSDGLTEWPTGLFVASGRGIVIYRDSENFINFDGSNPTRVDHDGTGGSGSWEWYKKINGTWQWATIVPGGYAAGVACANSGSPCGQDDITEWNRHLVSAIITSDGFEAVHETKGPWIRSGTFGPQYICLDTWRRTIRYNGQFIQVEDQWLGNNTQRINPNEPFFKARLFSPADGFQWQVSGADVVDIQSYSPEYVPNAKLLTISSNAVNGVMRVNFGPSPVPIPSVGTITIERSLVLYDELPAFSANFTFEVKFTGTEGGVLLGQTGGPIHPHMGIPDGYIPALAVGIDGILRSSMFWHGSTSARISSLASVIDGQEHHAIVVYDGQNEYLWLDGVLQGSQFVDQRPYGPGELHNWLKTGYTANWEGGNGDWQDWTGNLVVVQQLDHALTTDEVQALFDNPPPPPPPPPPAGPTVEQFCRQISDNVIEIGQRITLPILVFILFILWCSLSWALTPAQLQSLKTNIAANVNTIVVNGVATPINQVPISPDNCAAIAVWYNQVANPAFVVWRTDVSKDDVNNSVDWSEVVSLSTNNLLAFQCLKDQSSINASLSSVRTAFNQIFPAATKPNSNAALLGAAKRNATNAEQLFATGTGSTASPATMAVVGSISGSDVLKAMTS